MLLSTVGYVLLPSATLWANPTGEQVAGGAASFHRDGKNLTVNQSTDRLAVNWQDFSIAAGERTHFNMPSAASIALNRVLGGNPSQIYGTLSSNGNLILANNAGVFVGSGGLVNAASFVGSTLDIDPQQFMNAGQGRGMTLTGDSYAPIVNQGSIHADKGDVFLIAQKVENRGVISAPKGRAALVGVGRAADRTEVVLHEVGGSGFAVRVAQLEGAAASGSNHSLPDGEELLNDGEISAAQAELNASGNIYALAIRNSGTIRAKAVVVNTDGTVHLDGGSGNVINSGKILAKNAGDEATAAGGKIEITGQNVTASPESTITAAGGAAGGSGGDVKIDSEDTTIVQGKVDVAAPSAGAKGGRVELLGERVGLFEGAKVDASGGAGGGTVLVGGDYLGGRTPSADVKDLAKQETEPIKNANAAVMAETAEIKADATVNGDGGKVVWWTEEYTGFYGKIFARGGKEGGNGGFVETSSARNLQAFGQVDASASQGKSGHWLLDPYDIIIGTANNGISGPPVFTATGTADPATVDVGTINTALNGGTSVTVKTVSGGGTNATGTGAITVASSINKTGGAAATLTLDSISSIGGNGNIISSPAGGALSVSMFSVTDNTYGGNITTRNGAVNIISSGGSIKVAGGAINSGTGAISLSTTGLGSITLGSDLISSSSVTLNSTAGSITLNANIDVSSATTVVGPGTVSLSASSGISRGAGGVVTLPALQAASLAALTFRAGGNVTINVSTGAELAVGDPGPAISGETTSGSVTLRNVGPALSTLDEHGIRTTSGFELIGGLGTTILTGQLFDTGGSASYVRSGEVTAGIIIPNSSTRLFPKVVTPGSVTFQGVVTLSAYDITLPTETGLTVLSAGNGLQFRNSINDGSIAVTPDPLDPNAAIKSIAPTGNEQLLLISSNSGASAFQDFVGTAQAYSDAGGGVLVPADFLSLGPLASFRTEGGSLNFRATGTAVTPANPPVLGDLLRPSLYVLGPVSFDTTNLILEENTYITSSGGDTGGDILFGGTINALFADRAPFLVVETLDSDGDPDTPGGGQIVFNGAVGGLVPLGGVMVTARGFRNLANDPYGVSQTKDAQIAVNSGITTIPGTNPLQPGSFGQVSLRADGAVVIASTIETRGGLAQPTLLTGDVQIAANLTQRTGRADNAPENQTQLEGIIRTRGGTVTFGDGVSSSTGRVFVTASSTIDTYADNAQGVVTLYGNLNGDPGSFLTINAGTSPINFLGADSGYSIGDVSPVGLTVNSSGSVSFAGNVRMGGNFTFNKLSGNFNSAVLFDGNYDLTINPIIPESDLVLQALGSTIALRSLTIATSSTTLKLYGDILTSGAVSLGAPVEIQDDIAINTTKLSSNGGLISFRNTVTSVDGTKSLTMYAGNNSISVGEKIHDLKNLIVKSVASFQLASAASIEVVGSVEIRGNFTTNEQVATLKSQDVSITAGQDITISGSITTRPFYGEGGSVELTTTGGKIVIGGAIDTRGRSGTFTGFTPDGSGTFTFATTGYRGGDVTLSASTEIKAASVLAAGSNNFVTGGTGGQGGNVSITTTDVVSGDIQIGAIDTSGGTDGDLGGVGGNIDIVRGGRSGGAANPDGILVGSLTALGGDSDSGVGAKGGNITIRALRGNLKAPVIYRVAGGKGSAVGTDGVRLPSGQGGTVTLEATGEAGVLNSGNLYFAGPNVRLDADGGINMYAGRSIILATQPNFTKPELSVGGVIVTINDDAPEFNYRGDLYASFGLFGGQFYMPSSAYLITNGGKIAIDNLKTPTSSGDGAIFISGLTTTADNANGGDVLINQGAAAKLGAVQVSNAIETNGGVPSDPKYGRQGGAVSVSGTDITLNRIVTSGSSSLSTATAPAFGGAGGDIKILGTGTITLRRNLLAVGADGLAATDRDATGGSGGTVQIFGNLTLNSGDGTRSSIIIDTRGGSGQGDGDAGLGGNIIWGRQASGTAVVLNGTQGASSTLDLRYGSGTVILGTSLADRGSTNPDQINLETLISAADEARSTGILRVNARFGDPANSNSQPGLTSLVTYARPYAVELLGGGTIVNSVRFLNTGALTIGADATTETFFTGGLEAAATTEQPTAPYQVRLAGRVTVGSATDTSSAASMILDEVLLVGDTRLNSNGGNILMGTVDGGYDLIFLSGIGSGTATITGQVGRTTALDSIQIQRSGSALMTGNLLFGDDVRAAQMTLDDGYAASSGLVGASVSLRGNLTLSGGGYFGAYSSVAFDNSSLMTFSSGGLMTMAGELNWSGATLAMASSSSSGIFNLTSTGTMDGAQALTLSGAGAKTFSGTLGAVNAIGTGSGYAITISGGDVSFADITTSSGIFANAKVTFTSLATLGAGNTGSALNGDVELSAATLNSAGNVSLGDSSADTINVRAGTSTLTGAGSYTLNGTVSGLGSLILNGAGGKSFGTSVALDDLTQASGSGGVVFGGNVTLTGDARLLGAVTLTGSTFTGNGSINEFNTLTLSSGTVTLGGTGDYLVGGLVSGSQRLQLQGGGSKTFGGNVTVASLGQASGERASFAGNVTLTGNADLAGTVRLNGATFSTGSGTSNTFNVVELAAGTVTLGGGGSYTFQGGVGGNQALRLQGGGLKQFKEAVSVTGITQSASEVARFEKNVSTTSTSAFAGSVVLDEMVFDAQGNTSFADVSLATGEVTLQGAGAYTVNGAVSGGKDFVLLGGGTKTFASSLVVGKLTQTEGQIVLSGNVAASGLVNLADLSVRGEVMIDSANQNQTYGTILLGRNGATAGRLTADAGTGALVIGSTALARSKALAQAKAQGKRSTARAGADTTVVSGSGDLEVYADALVINGVIANQGAFGAFKPTGNLYLGDYTNPYLTSLSSIRSTAGVGFGALNGDLEARSLSSDYDLGLLASGDLIIESLTAKKELALVAENGQVTANGTSTAGLLNLSAQGVVGLENIRAQGFGTVDFTQPYDLQYETSGSFVTTGSINVRGGSVFISSGGTFVNSTGNNNPFGRDANVTIYSRELFNPQLQGAFIPGARLIRGTPPAQLAATSRAVGEVGSGAVTIYYDNVNNLIPYSREFTTGTGQPYVLATQNAVAGAMAPVAYSVAGAFPTKAAYTSEEIEMMTPQERAAYEASQRKQSAEVILQKKAGEPATTVPTDGKVPQAKVQETGQPAPTAQVELEGKPLAGVPAKEKNDSTQLLRVRPSKGLALQSDSDLQSVMEDERLAAEVNVSAAPVAGR